jgi:thiamine pyrophosphate-dependent acetolactate synthase large subunit-like protein
MSWDAIGRRTRLIHARHEHGAVTMADGFARYTGRPGVALITNGPGFTQVMTALTIAARSRSPLVVIAGDACQRLPFHIHTIDQAPLATATGAVYVPIRAVERLDHDLAYAFATARNRRLPVVVGIPEDMQRVPVETRYRPSDRLAVAAQRPRPDPVALAAALEPLLRAERPVILAGRGAVQAGPALVELADASGALLATSLLAKGLFDGHPFDVGVAGGLSTPARPRTLVAKRHRPRIRRAAWTLHHERRPTLRGREDRAGHLRTRGCPRRRSDGRSPPRS